MAGRIVNYVLMFLVGAVLGILGTIAHQSVIAVFGVRLPWGIVFSLAAVACLLAGLRLVNESRLVALVTAVGVVTSINLFTLRSFGGSVLVQNNLLGQIWVIAPIAICVVALAWPKSLHRETSKDHRASAA